MPTWLQIYRCRMNRLAMFELLAGLLMACLTYFIAERSGFDMPSVIAGVAAAALIAWSMFVTNLIGQYIIKRRK